MITTIVLSIIIFTLLVLCYMVTAILKRLDTIEPDLKGVVFKVKCLANVHDMKTNAEYRKVWNEGKSLI